MSRTASPSWWRPTWRRLVVGTVVLFLVVLAFLAGRLRAGLDPAQAALSATRSPAGSAGGTTATGSSESSGSESGDSGFLFGDEAEGGGSSGAGAATQDPSPPTTQAS